MIPAFFAYTGAFRESIVKPVFNFILGAFVILLIYLLIVTRIFKGNRISRAHHNILSWLVFAGILATGIMGYFSGHLGRFMFPTRAFLDANHFIISAVVVFIGVWIYLHHRFRQDRIMKFTTMAVFLFFSILSGVFMLIKLQLIDSVTRLAYTVFDISLIGILIISVVYIMKPGIITIKTL
ncbi:MAG: hypothetical protein K0B08_12335 [Bacteroidales bacterium]|nr:hypothetical protein [Bacteroidales bacterium]